MTAANSPAPVRAPQSPAPPQAPAPGRRWLWRLLLLLAGVIAALYVATGWAPPTDDYADQGPVVSADNMPVEWATLKATGSRFAYIDATFGSGRSNPSFAMMRDGARAAALPYGAMHHYDICALATDQAANVIRTVPRDAQALPLIIVIDYRDCPRPASRALLTSELTTFLAQVQAHLGQGTMIAPDRTIEAEYQLRDALHRPFMVKSFRRPPQEPDAGWTLWQANGYRRVDGAAGLVRWLVANPTTVTNVKTKGE